MLKAKTNRRESSEHEAAMAEIKRQKVSRINVDVPERVRTKFKAKVAGDPQYKDISDALRHWIYQYVKEEA